MELKLEHLAIAMVNNMLLQYFDDERELLHNDCKIVELREEEMTIANSEYQYDVKFDDVKIELFKQLSTGDFTVNVECANNKLFLADVIGYDDEYMTIKVKFHSDELTKPGRKEIPNQGFGYEMEETFTMVDCNIPVKVENIWWESIKLNK